MQLISSDYNKNAAEALKKSVKLDPTYTEAWNELGESYWRNGDSVQAKNCFEHAVKHSNNKNVDSLCKLSMILRQIRCENSDLGNKERSENLLKSLDLARKALNEFRTASNLDTNWKEASEKKISIENHLSTI